MKRKLMCLADKDYAKGDLAGNETEGLEGKATLGRTPKADEHELAGRLRLADGLRRPFAEKIYILKSENNLQ